MLVRTLILASITDEEDTFEAFAERLWNCWDVGRQMNTKEEYDKHYRWAIAAAGALPKSQRAYYSVERTMVYLMSDFDYHEASKRLERLVPPNHGEKLNVIHRRATLLIYQGYFQEASDLLMETYLQIRDTPVSLWPKDEGLAYHNILSTMQELLRVLGRYQEALSTNEICLRSSETYYFVSQSLTKGWTYLEFAATYLQMGDLSEAKAYNEKAYSLCRKEDIRLLGSIYRVHAMLLIEAGDYPAALDTLKKSIGIREVQLSKEHMDFAVFGIIQGDIQARQGRFQEAGKCYQEAKKIIYLHKNPYYERLVEERIRCANDGILPPKDSILCP